VDFQCVKSKSVTNLAEAAADPSIDNFDAGGNPLNVQIVAEPEVDGAVGGLVMNVAGQLQALAVLDEGGVAGGLAGPAGGAAAGAGAQAAGDANL
jgi:hypothetical protein